MGGLILCGRAYQMSQLISLHAHDVPEGVLCGGCDKLKYIIPFYVHANMELLSAECILARHELSRH